MDDRLEGQGTGQAPERSTEGTPPETDQRAAGRQQQQPAGGARRDRERERERDPRRRRPGGGREGQPTQQQQPPQHSRRAESSLNMEELQELFSMFTAQGLTEFELEKEGFRVKLRRDLTPPGSAAGAGPSAAQPLSAVQPTAQVLPFVAPQVTPAPSPEAAPAAAPTAEARPQPAEEPAEQLHIITSPIVGTFYRAASPTSDPFVRQGSRVEPDTVVCIIEAMKLMNEILAESSGTVEEVYVENGQPVEYGQSLFGIRK